MRRALYLILLSTVLPLTLGCTGDKTLMLQQLETLEQYNRADSLMLNDSLAVILVNYFNRHGSNNEQMRAYYILGRTYADQGEFPQALGAYNNAANRANTISADCDFRTLSRVHAQTALLYNNLLLPDNMIRHERLAMKYAEVAKDTMQYIACYGVLAEGYEMKILPDSALAILTEVYLLYNKVGVPELAAGVCCSMADVYRQKKDYQKAKERMQEYEDNSGFFDEQGNIEIGKEMYYSCKGHLCLDTDDKINAELYFRKLLRVAYNYSLEIAALDGLQRLYTKYYNKDSLVKYVQLSDSICNIAHNEIEIQKTLQVQSMFDYTRKELIASQKSREADRLRYILIIVVSLCIILILLFTIAYIRHQNAQRLLQSKYQAEMEKLAQAQTDLLALQSEQSVSKNLLSKKEQEIKTLQDTTEQYRKKIHTLQGYALNERLQQAPITLKVQQYLKHDPYLLPTFEDWRDLKVLINNEIPTFYNSLNVETNKLNDFEYDVCVLLRLQFSPANIAKLKKCTPAYITQIRRAIYKKLFQKEGRADDLDEYILSLS